MVVHLGDCADSESDDPKSFVSLDQMPVSESRKRRTNVHDPPEADRPDKTTVSEALHPKPDRKPSPSANKILRLLPKEYRHATTTHTSNDTSQHKHPSEFFIRRIDSFQDTKLENQRKACEREGVEANKEE